MADPITQGTTLDILPNRSGPPLSATSDMPVVAAVETTTPVEPKAPAESENLRAEPIVKIEAKPEAETPAAPEQTPEEIAAEAAKKAAKEDKTDAGIKREIAKERDRRREAEANADKLSQDLTKALDAIKDLTAKPAEPVEDPRPVRTAFDDPNAYDDALVQWSARQATEIATREAEAKALEAKSAEEAERAQKDQQAQVEQTQAEWTARRDKALEKYPDYAEVAEADDLQISMPMGFAILNAGDAGPELAYHLGKNPDEAKRIASYVISDGKGGMMPNAPMQVFELGKLAAKISAPKPVSRTPDPIQPLGARERATEKPAEEMSMDEYANSSAVKARLAGDRSSRGYAAH